METAVLHYRYPGSRPFQDTDLDRRLFFGREHETQLLLHTVLAERLTVLFAKSGMGKTSLLNAGIMQLLRKKNFFPFKVRFNILEMTPLQAVYESIKRSLHQKEDEYDPQRTLLDYFQTFEFSSLDLWASEEVSLTPVLILDQFEEFFTLHVPENRQAFTQQLADLAKNRNQEIKILISIREDFLGHLEEIAQDLPDIFQNRFRISALTREQAKKAIEEPARIDNALLSTTQFHYAPEAVGTMLDFLCRQRKQGQFILSDEVEPFQLQLLCQYIEQMVRGHSEKKESLIIVQKDQLGGETGMQQILENFYDYQIGQLDLDLKKRRICNLCEYGLISISNRRLSLEEEDIEIRFNVTKDILTKLVDSRLLRAEPRVGSVYYELSHDTLIEPIRNSQKRRQARQTSVRADVQKLYQEAGQSEIEGDIDTAIQRYQKVIDIDKTFVKAYIELGQLYAEQGRLAKAVKIYKKAIYDGIKNAAIYYQLGKMLGDLGNLEEAIKNFHEAITLDPELSLAYINLGNIYRRQRKFVEAIEHYEKALYFDNQNSSVYKELAILHIKQGQIEQAIEVYQHALEISSEYAYIYSDLIQALEEEGMESYAETIYNIASNANSTHASHYYRLGLAVYRQRNYTEAIKNYQKAIQLAPNLAYVWSGLGSAFYRLGQYERAKESYEMAIKLDPNFAYPYSNLAHMLLKQGKYEEAIRYYQTIIQLIPKDVEFLVPQNAYFYAGLSSALYEQNRYEDAYQMSEKAFNFAPENIMIRIKFIEANILAEKFDTAVRLIHEMLDKEDTLRENLLSIQLITKKVLDSMLIYLCSLFFQEKRFESFVELKKFINYYQSFSSGIRKDWTWLAGNIPKQFVKNNDVLTYPEKTILSILVDIITEMMKKLDSIDLSTLNTSS